MVAGSDITNNVSFSVTSYAETPPEITSPDTTFEATLSDVDPDAEAMLVDLTDPDFNEDR